MLFFYHNVCSSTNDPRKIYEKNKQQKSHKISCSSFWDFTGSHPQTASVPHLCPPNPQGLENSEQKSVHPYILHLISEGPLFLCLSNSHDCLFQPVCAFSHISWTCGPGAGVDVLPTLNCHFPRSLLFPATWTTSTSAPCVVRSFPFIHCPLPTRPTSQFPQVLALEAPPSAASTRQTQQPSCLSGPGSTSLSCAVMSASQPTPWSSLSLGSLVSKSRSQYLLSVDLHALLNLFITQFSYLYNGRDNNDPMV